jgi:hypothetical protein
VRLAGFACTRRLRRRGVNHFQGRQAHQPLRDIQSAKELRIDIRNLDGDHTALVLLVGAELRVGQCIRLISGCASAVSVNIV